MNTNQIQLEPDDTDALTAQLLEQGAQPNRIPQYSSIGRRDSEVATSPPVGGGSIGTSAPYHFAFGRGGRQAQLLNYQTRQAEVQFEHEKEMKALDNKMAMHLAQNASTIKMAESKGIPAFDQDGNYTEAYTSYVQQLAPQIIANGVTTAKKMAEVMDDPKFIETLKQGSFASNITPAVSNAKELSQVVPKEATGMMPPVVGVNTQAPVVTYGSIANQTSYPIATTINPLTHEAITQGIATNIKNTPGGVQVPISQDDKNAVQGQRQQGSSMTPPDVQTEPSNNNFLPSPNQSTISNQSPILTQPDFGSITPNSSLANNPYTIQPPAQVPKLPADNPMNLLMLMQMMNQNGGGFGTK